MAKEQNTAFVRARDIYTDGKVTGEDAQRLINGGLKDITEYGLKLIAQTDTKKAAVKETGY
jgi:hypothetical protein